MQGLTCWWCLMGSCRPAWALSRSCWPLSDDRDPAALVVTWSCLLGVVALAVEEPRCACLASCFSEDSLGVWGMVSAFGGVVLGSCSAGSSCCRTSLKLEAA